MAVDASTTTFAAVDPVHDGRHELAADRELQRESVPYVFSLPDEGIAGYSYTWVDRENRAGSTFALYGPTIGDEPIVASVNGVDVAPDMSFDDWTVGPVTVRHDLRFQRADLELVSDRAQLRGTFEGLHPAYAYANHPEGCPDYLATDRIEQTGRLRGTLALDGRDIEVDAFCARDHSWGTRDWKAAQHWKWLHAAAGDRAVHFWLISARGRTDLRGYVLRDGHTAEVADVDVAFTHDDVYDHRTIDVTVRDAEDRNTRVQGEYFTHHPLIPEESTVLNEGAMRCTIDGAAGGGWTEFMWPMRYLEHLRARASSG